MSGLFRNFHELINVINSDHESIPRNMKHYCQMQLAAIILGVAADFKVESIYPVFVEWLQVLRPSGRKYNIRINIYAFVIYFNFSSLGMSFMRLFWLLGTADLGIPIFLPGGVSILEEFIG